MKIIQVQYESEETAITTPLLFLKKYKIQVLNIMHAPMIYNIRGMMSFMNTLGGTLT
jgi:hypothetical protein